MTNKIRKSIILSKGLVIGQNKKNRKNTISRNKNDELNNDFKNISQSFFNQNKELDEIFLNKFDFDNFEQHTKCKL
jgi:hypothetical protein